MSAFFSTLSCCWFWLLLGVLIGWLLNRLLCKCSSKNNPNQSIPTTKPAPTTPAETSPTTKPAPTTPAETSPPAKMAETPASTVVTPALLVTPSDVKATPKPAAKPAKPKSAVKPASKAASSVVAIDIAAAKAAGFSLKNADDLTIVEGIGPKINELLIDNGIKTFAELAEQTVPQIRAILDKGGARFRIANPATWAKQAKLASTNKWAELKKLQDELSAGVKK